MTEHVLDHLSAYLDGELGAAEQERFRAHLAQCASCAQRLAELAAVDRSLRELGVSDVTVGKKVRKIAESYYGRVIAYDKALSANADILQKTIGRNIYPDGASEGVKRAMASYIVEAAKLLGEIPLENITQGELRFP